MVVVRLVVVVVVVLRCQDLKKTSNIKTIGKVLGYTQAKPHLFSPRDTSIPIQQVTISSTKLGPHKRDMSNQKQYHEQSKGSNKKKSQLPETEDEYLAGTSSHVASLHPYLILLADQCYLLYSWRKGGRSWWEMESWRCRQVRFLRLLEKALWS